MPIGSRSRRGKVYRYGLDDFISFHTETHEHKKKKPRGRSCPQRLFTRIIMRVKVVCTLTRQLSTAASPAVKPSTSAFDGESVGRPDPELPHGAGTVGAEAPRQRRA